MYYRFRQNNSGGYLREPALNVYVEASSEQEALNAFTQIDGCYFDPEYKRDCRCCGNRWDEYIWDRYLNDYELMRAIEQETKEKNSWSVKKEEVPFAYIKSVDKVTLIP
jgi:hypothetical protein